MRSDHPLQGIWRLLRSRFREARLGQVAGSLTFTTLLALVPLLTVMLALFSAFPVFASFQVALEKFFLYSLIPEGIARPVLKTVTQFATQATRLGALGLLGVVMTALALMLTIDRALNRIWRVRRPRAISQRLLIYMAAVTLGPLAVGISFTGASYAFTAARGWGPAMPVIISTLVELLEACALLLGVMGLYRFLPNTPVRWRDALSGALFVVLAFTLAKEALGWYVGSVSTFSVVYGAFATLPILLMWIYIVWAIILAGAVLASGAPSLGGSPAFDDLAPGARFALALRLLRELASLRDGPQPAIGLMPLSGRLRADPMEVRTLADEMVLWGWLIRVEDDAAAAGGYLLGLHPRQCDMVRVAQTWLLAPQAGVEPWLTRAGGQGLTLADLL